MLLARELTERVIGLAIEVHRLTGPGMLESVYEGCLCHELDQGDRLRTASRNSGYLQGRPIRRRSCSRPSAGVLL